MSFVLEDSFFCFDVIFYNFGESQTWAIWLMMIFVANNTSFIYDIHVSLEKDFISELVELLEYVELD